MKKNFILVGALFICVISLLSCGKRECWTCTTLVTDRAYSGNLPTNIINQNDTIMCGVSNTDVNAYKDAHNFTLNGSDGKPNYIEYTECR